MLSARQAVTTTRSMTAEMHGLRQCVTWPAPRSMACALYLVFIASVSAREYLLSLLPDHRRVGLKATAQRPDFSIALTIGGDGDKLMYGLPNEAEDLLMPIMDPYSQSPAFYFDKLGFGARLLRGQSLA